MIRRPPSLLRRVLLWVPAILWYRLIWGFSAQGGEASGEVSDRLLYQILEAVSSPFRQLSADGQFAVVEFLSFYERKAAHMFLYFVLMALLLLAIRGLFHSRGWQAAGAVILCGALAVLDEYHQTLVPGRSGEVRDVLVDLAGGLCFLLVWWLARCLKDQWSISRKKRR